MHFTTQYITLQIDKIDRDIQINQIDIYIYNYIYSHNMLCYNPCCYSELPLIFPSACGLVDDPLLNPTVPAAGALFHQLRYGNNEVLVRQNLKRCGCWVGLSGWIEPEYPAAFLFAAHVTTHCSATQHALLQSMLLQRAASHFSICLWFG